MHGLDEQEQKLNALLINNFTNIKYRLKQETLSDAK
jgi:hypothetical protein